MAQRLLEKYHVPYLSIDHFKMGLYRADQNCGFTPLDSTEYIGEKLWPILKGIIMTNIENNQNLIIEGCYVLPHHRHSKLRILKWKRTMKRKFQKYMIS
ncbi:hypothetical protein ABER99_06270 [Paenibacillus glucanolyticus]|jgi:putative acetyltransferase|nr:hypothetical protein [Paenibacillus glucanolyticus]